MCVLLGNSSWLPNGSLSGLGQGTAFPGSFQQSRSSLLPSIDSTAESQQAFGGPGGLRGAGRPPHTAFTSLFVELTWGNWGFFSMIELVEDGFSLTQGEQGFCITQSQPRSRRVRVQSLRDRERGREGREKCPWGFARMNFTVDCNEI